MRTTANHQASLVVDVVDALRRAAKIPLRVPIKAESRLVEDLGIDSLDLVGVILHIEEHFGVAIDEDAVPNLCRVADLAAHLSAGRESARA
jgi:acyl carrier protein